MTSLLKEVLCVSQRSVSATFFGLSIVEKLLDGILTLVIMEAACSLATDSELNYVFNDPWFCSGLPADQIAQIESCPTKNKMKKEREVIEQNECKARFA